MHRQIITLRNKGENIFCIISIPSKEWFQQRIDTKWGLWPYDPKQKNTCSQELDLVHITRFLLKIRLLILTPSSFFILTWPDSKRWLALIHNITPSQANFIYQVHHSFGLCIIFYKVKCHIILMLEFSHHPLIYPLVDILPLGFSNYVLNPLMAQCIHTEIYTILH